MPKLGLKRQPRRNEHTVSKPGALAVISGDHMATTMTTGLTEGRVLDQHSRLLDPDTSSVLDALAKWDRWTGGPKPDGLSRIDQIGRYTHIQPGDVIE